MRLGGSSRVRPARVQQCADLLGGRGELRVRPAVHESATAVGALQSQQQPQDGRLSGAVRADEASDSAGRGEEVDAVEHRRALVCLGQCSYLNQ
jgi:hypothetical protein